ncbi:hypothetical protein FRB94_007429 [Tulasnella sp. JGI-2019a]|nr:hypothetical protein FRB94_007429 [Tulasnella sp. JGI-2019a]
MATASYRVYLGPPNIGDVLEEIEETISSNSAREDVGMDVNHRSWHIIETTTQNSAVLPASTPAPRVSINIHEPTPTHVDTTRLTILDRTRLEATTSFLQHHDTSSRVSKPGSSRSRFRSLLPEDDDVGGVLPYETFIEASQRLSKLYENVIFPDNTVEEEPFDEEDKLCIERSLEDQSRDSDDDSAITWDLTDPINTRAQQKLFGGGANRLNANETFIRTSGETKAASSYRFSATGTQLESQLSTFSSELSSYEEEDSGGSIGRFPTFHFNLHRLSSLHTLLKAIPARKEKRLVCLLVAVLEIEGPTLITTKAGVEMGLLKLIVGDELGMVAKIVCWRETALDWGGGEDRMGEGAVRKGDVVFLENLAVTYNPPAPTTLSASPSERSQMIICYRTLPMNAREDRHYRPDLRLGQSDAALRRVATVVRWVEEVANIHR